MLIWSLYFSMGRQTNKTKILGKLEGIRVMEKNQARKRCKGYRCNLAGPGTSLRRWQLSNNHLRGEKGPILQMGEANFKENSNCLSPEVEATQPCFVKQIFLLWNHTCFKCVPTSYIYLVNHQAVLKHVSGCTYQGGKNNRLGRGEQKELKEGV